MLRLREIRKQRGMTQCALASAAKVAQGVISDLENGRCYPSFKLLLRLAKVLECSLDELVVMEDEPVAS